MKSMKYSTDIFPHSISICLANEQEVNVLVDASVSNPGHFRVEIVFKGSDPPHFRKTKGCPYLIKQNKYKFVHHNVKGTTWAWK